MAKVLLYVLANCNSAGCWLVVVVKPHCSAKTEEPQEFTKWEHKTTNRDDFVNDTTKAFQESSPGGISLELERGGGGSIIGAAGNLYFSQPFSHEYRKPLRSRSWFRLQANPVVTGITLSVTSISGMKGSLFATFLFSFFF